MRFTFTDRLINGAKVEQMLKKNKPFALEKLENLEIVAGINDLVTTTLRGWLDVQEEKQQKPTQQAGFVNRIQKGLLPQLDLFTATLQPVAAADACLLRPERGIVEAGPGDSALSGDLLQHLQVALDRGAMANLQAACLDGLSPLRAGLRALLHYHLGSPRLRTREVMIDAQQFIDSPRPAPANDPMP